MKNMNEISISKHAIPAISNTIRRSRAGLSNYIQQVYSGMSLRMHVLDTCFCHESPHIMLICTKCCLILRHSCLVRNGLGLDSEALPVYICHCAVALPTCPRNLQLFMSRQISTGAKTRWRKRGDGLELNVEVRRYQCVFSFLYNFIAF